MHRILFACTIVLLTVHFLFFICVPGSHADEAKQRPSVMVSILPQEFFVQRIGGDRVDVASLVQPGHSPATYSPTPKQMTALATADIYFRIGVPFENSLIPKLARSVPGLPIIDLRQGIDLLPVVEPDSDHVDAHGDMDPHTWLDPMLALKQSATILAELIRFDPAGASEYNNNFASLAEDLKQLDFQLREILKPFAGKSIYVFHPAYGYFCRAYGLKQKAINPDGKEPGARHLARLIEQAEKESVRVLFVQPQFSDKAARTIARSIKAHIVALDPLARDYLGNMQAMARQLSKALSDGNQ